MPVGTAWTEEEDAFIRARWPRGVSATRIADEMRRELRTGRSRNAIIGRVNRLHITQEGREKPAAPTSVRLTPAPRRPKSVIPETAKPLSVTHAEVSPPRQLARNPGELAVDDVAPIKIGAVWPVPATAKPTLELAARDCRFPVGPATGEHQLYCGGVAPEGDVYCPGHRAVASAPSQPKALIRHGRLPEFARS